MKIEREGMQLQGHDQIVGAKCTACGKVYEEDVFDFCPECGGKANEVVKDIVAYTCPECDGESVLDGYRFCPWCGKAIDWTD